MDKNNENNISKKKLLEENEIEKENIKINNISKEENPVTEGLKIDESSPFLKQENDIEVGLDPKEAKKHKDLVEDVKTELEEKKKVKVEIDNVIVPKKQYAEDLKHITETITHLNEKINTENESKKEEKKREKRKRRKRSAIVFGTVALALFIVLVPYPADKAFSIVNIISFFRDIITPQEAIVIREDELYNPQIRKTDNQEAIDTGGLSMLSKEDRQKNLNDISEGSRVYCIISSSPYFPSITEKGALFISNPAESVFHTQVIIEEKETGEEMYVSSLLAPNEKIEYDYLTNKTYGEGEYVAMAYFNYYDGRDSDFSYKGTVSVEILIKIGN